MDSKKAKQIMKNLRSDYNTTASSFASSRDRMWPEFKFLFDYTKKNEKVLDLGCGNGRFSQYLEDAEYVGADFSEKMIQEAKKRFSEKQFVVADATKLPFEDNYFDKVYSIAMIHQIPSHEYRLKALLEIKRVLNPNGSIFLTVWKASGTPPPRCFERGEGKDVFLKRDRYYYLFDEGELSSLAEEAGFSIKEEGVVEKDNRSNIYIIAEKSNSNKKL